MKKKKKSVISTRPSLGLALKAVQVRWETTDQQSSWAGKLPPKGINDFRNNLAAADQDMENTY